MCLLVYIVNSIDMMEKQADKYNLVIPSPELVVTFLSDDNSSVRLSPATSRSPNYTNKSDSKSVSSSSPVSSPSTTSQLSITK